MRYKFFLIFLFFTVCISEFVYGQKDNIKKDSTKIYRDIETFSKKRKSTKYIYHLLFLPIATTPIPKSKISKKQHVNLKSNRNFEGKIIRNINITTLNPFGYSISDTVPVSQNLLFRAGNNLHIRTRQITIRNLLLIHQNKSFDSLLVKESERLIRAQQYVHEVSFTVQSTEKKSDSVDIYIRVLDTWSIIPDGAISSSGFSIGLEEKNFIGFGHDFQGHFSQNVTNGKNTINTNYFVPNIDNTYVSTTLHYQSDENNNYTKILSIDRPFFSPFAKWAAGIYVAQQFQVGQIKTGNLLYQPQNFKFNTQDLWAGFAQRIFKGNTENVRTTNLIVAGRFVRTRYIEGPAEIYDTLHQYANSDFYLLSIGISTRKYVQDKFIFNYGITEDVPIGMVYSITGGYNVKNYSGQLYLGAKASFGNYNKWGYLSTDFEYGTFLRSGNSVQGVFSTGFNYFTELLEIGGVKLRQFIKPQYVTGINRLPNESININNANGIQGFNSPTLIGTQKIMLTFQTQMYLPWSFIGFHFGPYLIYSLGMLGNQASGFNRSRVYSQVGIGVLIKNEYLVFNIFQVSIAFYPTIPGMGNNVIDINPNKASDFGFRNFEIGKPSTVAYQ